MYFKRKQSYRRSIAGPIWRSPGSITAGFCGFDLQLCQQSKMCKALNPAPVIQETNDKYQPLVWQSRTSCIIRGLFWSVTVAKLVTKSKSLMEWVVFDFPRGGRQTAKKTCVFCSPPLRLTGHKRSRGPSGCRLNGVHKTVEWSYSCLIRPSSSQS